MTETESPPISESPVPSPQAPPAEAPVPGAAPAAGTERGPRNRRGGRGGRGRGQAAEGAAPAATRQPPAAAPGRGQAPARPARQPSPVLERLFELYPRMFGARFLPLKLGVFQELMARHGEEFKKDELKLALGQHARSTRYLEAVAAGEQRHDLQGEPVEAVAPEHIHHAILEVYRRRQSRSKDDLRPWLQARLVNAIEASGLTREAWDERVGATDEFSVGALDAAFAALAEKTARREALKRAYEASGRGVEEFAEMYGMDPAAVRHALEPAANR